jgi:hypothetical protein
VGHRTRRGSRAQGAATRMIESRVRRCRGARPRTRDGDLWTRLRGRFPASNPMPDTQNCQIILAGMSTAPSDPSARP